MPYVPDEKMQQSPTGGLGAQQAAPNQAAMVQPTATPATAQGLQQALQQEPGMAAQPGADPGPAGTHPPQVPGTAPEQAAPPAQPDPQAQPQPGPQPFRLSGNPFAPQLAQQVPMMPGQNMVSRPPMKTADKNTSVRMQEYAAQREERTMPDAVNKLAALLKLAANKRAAYAMSPSVTENEDAGTRNAETGQPAAHAEPDSLPALTVASKRAGVMNLFGMERSGTGQGTKKPKIVNWTREGEDAFLDRSELYYGSGKRKRSGNTKAAFELSPYAALPLAGAGVGAAFGAGHAGKKNRIRGAIRGAGGGLGAVLGGGLGLLGGVYGGAALGDTHPNLAKLLVPAATFAGGHLGMLGGSALAGKIAPDEEENYDSPSLMYGGKYASHSNNRLFKSAGLAKALIPSMISGGVDMTMAPKGHRIEGAGRGAIKGLGMQVGATGGTLGLLGIAAMMTRSPRLMSLLSKVPDKVGMPAAALTATAGIGAGAYGGYKGMAKLIGPPSWQQKSGSEKEAFIPQAVGLGLRSLGLLGRGAGAVARGAGGLARGIGTVAALPGQALNLAGKATGAIGRGVGAAGRYVDDVGKSLMRPQGAAKPGVNMTGGPKGPLPPGGVPAPPPVPARAAKAALPPSTPTGNRTLYDAAGRQAVVPQGAGVEALDPTFGLQSGGRRILRDAYGRTTSLAPGHSGPMFGADDVFGQQGLGKASPAKGVNMTGGPKGPPPKPSPWAQQRPATGAGSGRPAPGMGNNNVTQPMPSSTPAGNSLGSLEQQTAQQLGRPGARMPISDPTGKPMLTPPLPPPARAAGATTPTTMDQTPSIGSQLVGPGLQAADALLSKSGAELDNLDAFALSFLDKCVELQLTKPQFQLAIKRASAVHPDVKASLEPLTKDANWGTAARTAWQAGKSMLGTGRAAFNAGRQGLAKMPNMLPPRAGFAAAENVGHALGRGAGAMGDAARTVGQYIPKGLGQTARGMGTGYVLGGAVDSVGDVTGLYDTGGWGGRIGAALGGGFRNPYAAKMMNQAGMRGSIGLGRKFFTGGGTANPALAGTGLGAFQKGLGRASAGAFGLGMVKDYARGQGEQAANDMMAQHAQNMGFNSTDEMAQFGQMLNSGDVMGMVQHGWGRLSPQQKMMIGGGGALLGGGLLAGAMGHGGMGAMAGLGGAGLMGAGAMLGGNRSGLFPGMGQPPQPQPQAGIAGLDPDRQPGSLGGEGPGMSMIEPRNELQMQHG